MSLSIKKIWNAAIQHREIGAQRTFALVVLALMLHVLAQSAGAQYVYYNESPLGGGGFKIHPSALDGSSHQLLLTRSEYPRAFAVDPISRKLYWSAFTTICGANGPCNLYCPTN